MAAHCRKSTIYTWEIWHRYRVPILSHPWLHSLQPILSFDTVAGLFAAHAYFHLNNSEFNTVCAVTNLRLAKMACSAGDGENRQKTEEREKKKIKLYLLMFKTWTNFSLCTWYLFFFCYSTKIPSFSLISLDFSFCFEIV